jgi:hypothetical protein
MPITIGNGTITGISSGGLPNGIITGTTVADGNITTAKLISSLYANSKTTNGYAYLPNGLIFQWGTANTGATTITITYPIAFPTACFHVKICRYAAGDTAGVAAVIGVGGPSTTPGSSSQIFTVQSGITVYWTAIGY